MKKVLFLLFVIFTPIVYAKEYEIKELDLKLNVNDDWYVLTRDNLDGNDFFNDYDLSKDYLLNSFTLNKAYMDAFPKDLSVEFFITNPASNLEIHNLSNYPDKMIDKEAKKVTKDLKDVHYSIYSSNQNKFMEISFFDTATSMYIYRYYTIVNAEGIGFHIQKKTTFTDSEKQELKKIADSVTFEIQDAYKNETPEAQKEIDNNMHPLKPILIHIIIYAIGGGIVGVISSILVKRKQKKANI